MSALAGTISAPFVTPGGGIDAFRWLRTGLSLALALAVLAIALPIAFDAGARAGVDPVQVFSSDPVVAVDAAGGAELSVSGLVPGQSRSATIRLSNAGSETSVFTLRTHLADQAAPGGKPLSSVLDLRIAAADGATLYEGTLADLRALSLGRLGAGDVRAYDFTVSMSRSVGNEVEGSTLSAGFSWTAG